MTDLILGGEVEEERVSSFLSSFAFIPRPTPTMIQYISVSALSGHSIVEHPKPEFTKWTERNSVSTNYIYTGGSESIQTP